MIKAVLALLRKPAALASLFNQKLTGVMIAAFVMAVTALPSFAQTAVPLEIPTNVIFSETNNWLETFAPIAAIGIGISIALAVLGYLGKMIVSAFRG